MNIAKSKTTKFYPRASASSSPYKKPKSVFKKPNTGVAKFKKIKSQQYNFSRKAKPQS